jgi:phage tail sheath gpL-like
MTNIVFQNYNPSNRVPGFYADFDSSGANTTLQNNRALLVGQMTSAGTFTPNVQFLGMSLSDVGTKVGVGSMLYDMYQAYRLADPFTELWLLPLQDGAGSAATVPLTLAGTATSVGALATYVNGAVVPVSVAVGDTAASIATNLASAVNTNPASCVSAAVAGAVVTFTSKNKGVAAGDISVQVNFRGTPNGEVLPGGITTSATGSFAAVTAGTTDPDPTIALSNLGDLNYDYIAFPYNTSTPLTAFKTIFNDSNGRWSWQVQAYGVAFNAIKGSLGTIQTYGYSQNDHHISTLATLNSPTPNWRWAAAYAGAVAQSANTNPAVPLSAIQIMGVVAPTIDQWLQASERNTLYWSGISNFTVQNDGTVYLERAVTNYQKNAAGVPDNSWLDVETDFQLTYSVRYIRTMVATTFSRKILVNDGAVVAGNNAMVSPSTVAQYVVGLYTNLANLGIVQNVASFAAAIQAQNAGGGTVALTLPLILSNQLRIVACDVNFSKP